uniref:C2 domain-containing protein n=1 Tax=Haptolina brevifila TaxID=156173 RepID=A0A7S2CR31_9EUKA
MKAIKFQYISMEPSSGLYLKVTLGGDYSEREEPGKGLVKKGKRGLQFKTSSSPKLRNDDVHYFQNSFGASVPIYWIGSYVDLEMEELQLELWQSQKLKKAKKRSSYSTPLISVAQNSVQGEIVFRDEKAAGEKGAPPLVRVTYVLFFEELFVFQLRFVNWRGTDLRASDAPKKKGRALVDEIRAKRKAELEAKKVKERAEKEEAAKAKKAKAMQDKIDAARYAQSGGRYGAARKSKADSTGPAATTSTSDTGGAVAGSDATAAGGAPAGAPTAESENTGLLAGAGAGSSEGADAEGKKRKAGGFSLGLPFGKRGKAEKPKKLLYEERVQIQKEKDDEKKKLKDAKNLERLRKLKKQQDDRETKRLARVEQEKKAQAYDTELYEDAKSDPYIVFSIDPPIAPGCKIIRNGGYFGRTVRTDINLNTLDPFFEEARKPLAYLGTRSELENEILRIRVYDWDFYTPDDLIGMADVPLNGLLEYGQVEVELTFDRADTSKKKVRGKYPKITEPAGKVMGQIVFEGQTPDYNQLGLIVERKPGIVYLAVKINSATKLTAADPNGYSDPFAVVDWDGAQQSSRVIERSLDPVWNETLYFPLKLVTITQESLQNKPPVVIRIFDRDESGHDLLGSCEIPLHLITSAPHAKVDSEKGNDGRPHKGRVYRVKNQKLVLPAFNIHSTLNIELYFAPDLPLDIVLEEDVKRRTKELEEIYATRLKSFWKDIPPKVQTALETGMLKEFDKVGQSDYEISAEQLRRIVSAEDQDEVEHFMCEYLHPMVTSSDMSNEMQVARMVRCITWENDTETFKKEFKTDVWQSPPFFLKIRKGDFEDHALLMCNLFLGLNDKDGDHYDAYVCVGRLKSSSEKEKRHVWVMTREKDKSVRMWETSTGRFRTIPNAWRGTKAVDGDAQADKNKEKKKAPKIEEVDITKALKSGIENVGKAAKVGVDVLENVDKAVKGAGKSKAELSLEAVKAEAKKAKAARMAGAGAIPGEEEALLAAADNKQSMWAEDLLEEFNKDDLLSTLEVEHSMEEVQWFDGEEMSMEASSASEAATELRQMRELARQEAKEAEQKEDLEDGPSGRKRVVLPYGVLECVFNHENLWVSTETNYSKVLDPANLTYDFDDPKDQKWLPFVIAPMEKPKAFYTSSGQRLAAKVPNERLRNMEQQILQEVKSQLFTIRQTKAPAPINRSDELIKTLERGLGIYEDIEQGDKETEAAKRAELGGWTRDLKGRLPPNSKFTGTPFHYAYTDPKRIRRNLLSAVSYAETNDEGIEFVVAVKAFAFHGSICSVWVYFGMIDTNLLN